MEVRLFPEGGPDNDDDDSFAAKYAGDDDDDDDKGISATLKITCNIPPEGLFTGLPEGYFLDIQDGLSFVPATFPGGFPIGVTAFGPGNGDDDDDDD